ncbi:hypothetical protein Hanom_Chr13g01213831 [Helianthus anomalus]
MLSEKQQKFSWNVMTLHKRNVNNRSQLVLHAQNIQLLEAMGSRAESQSARHTRRWGLEPSRKVHRFSYSRCRVCMYIFSLYF